LADLRDSGSIEQDADVVCLLHPNPKDPSEVELLVAKNRSGPVGKMQLCFTPEITRFDAESGIPDELLEHRPPEDS
jgi:replicative DNA helicase